MHYIFANSFRVATEFCITCKEELQTGGKESGAWSHKMVSPLVVLENKSVHVTQKLIQQTYCPPRLTWHTYRLTYRIINQKYRMSFICRQYNVYRLRNLPKPFTTHQISIDEVGHFTQHCSGSYFFTSNQTPFLHPGHRGLRYYVKRSFKITTNALHSQQILVGGYTGWFKIFKKSTLPLKNIIFK